MKSFESYFNRLQKMNKLIENRCTGSPCEFASKIGLSRRAMFVAIDDLRERVGKYGVHIVFDRQIQSYIYDQPGSFEIKDNFYKKD
jgi:hypothetical protein